MPRSIFAATVLAAACAMPASACLWDFDTLAVERSRFPEVLELITGKFPRHSREFYEWRIQDRVRRLAASPDRLDWLDDLAVAFDKTDRHEDAVREMLQALRQRPDRYETLANLGTLYLHWGRLDEGLTYISRAIQVNPEAHFGREVVQKLLVEYVRGRGLEQRPLRQESRGDIAGFAAFVEKRRGGLALPLLHESARTCSAARPAWCAPHAGRAKARDLASAVS